MLESCERRLMQGDLPRCDFDLAELRHFVSLSEELFGYWLLILYLSTQLREPFKNYLADFAR